MFSASVAEKMWRHRHICFASKLDIFFNKRSDRIDPVREVLFERA
jgi:hypothetical protein